MSLFKRYVKKLQGEMIMKKRRFLSAVAAVMSVALIAGGCGEKKNDVSDNTVTWWTGYGGSVANGTNSLADNLCIQELMKRTGVNIEFSQASSTDWSEQFNLMLASGEYTDIFMYPMYTYPGGPQMAIDENIIMPLNDVFKKYCPNITAYLNEHPEIDKMIKTDEGQYYCFPPIYGDEYLQVYRGPIIRQDLLDKLGLERPETIDEWTNVLTRFKNELGIEVPLTFHSNYLFTFLEAYGTIPELYIDNGKVKYGATDPAFKDAVAKMNEWYTLGLLDNNIATIDSKFINQNMLNGRSGATVGATGGGIGTLMKQKTDDPSFNLTAAKYPVLKKGDTPMYGQRVHAAVLDSTSCASLSTQCKNIEAAAKVLDYGYSEEGQMLFNFGIEGVSYNMIDGYPTYTDIITKDKQNRSIGTMLSYYSCPSGIWPSIRDKRYMEQNAETPQQKESIEIWGQTDAKIHMMPQVTLSAEESEQVSTIETDLKTYVSSMMLKFITGVEPMSNFDAFTNKVKEMKADKYVSIYQKAYDRYMKR